MLTSGPAKKVAIYVAEDQHYCGTCAYAAITGFLFFRGGVGRNGDAGHYRLWLRPPNALDSARGSRNPFACQGRV